MPARLLLLFVVGIACGGLASCGTAGAGDDATTGGMAPSSGGAADGSGGSDGSGAAVSSGGSNASGGLGGSAGDVPAAHCNADGDGRTTLEFVNGCDQTLEYAGSDIAGGTLAPGATECIDIGSSAEELSAKRYFGWVGENPGAEHHSLAEFTFNTDFYDFDWYNISFVDAFNLPMRIVPVARPNCDTLTCADDLLPGCPSVGLSADSSGTVSSCVSPDRDDPESPVALYFESCDEAYAWSGDDQQGTDPSPVKACAGEDWEIVFCPTP